MTSPNENDLLSAPAIAIAVDNVYKAPVMNGLAKRKNMFFKTKEVYSFKIREDLVLCLPQRNRKD